MADYTRRTWVDNSTPDLEAVNLNAMEAGIKDAAQDSKQRGLIANRPAAAVANKNWLWIASDEGNTTYYSDGAAWHRLTPGRAIGAFSAYRSATVAISTGAWTAITFDGEHFDVSGWYDTTNGRYTPQVAGYYRLSSTLHLPTLADTNTYGVSIWKNGARIHLGGLFQASGAADLSATSSVVVSANGSSDYFQIAAFRTNAGNLFGDAAGVFSFFQGEFIGAA